MNFLGVEQRARVVAVRPVGSTPVPMEPLPPVCTCARASLTHTCTAEPLAHRRALAPHGARNPHRSPSGTSGRRHVDTSFPSINIFIDQLRLSLSRQNEPRFSHPLHKKLISPGKVASMRSNLDPRGLAPSVANIRTWVIGGHIRHVAYPTMRCQVVWLKSRPGVAGDAETMVASRRNAVTGNQNTARTCTPRRITIVDRAREGQEPTTAAALSERAVCAGQEGATWVARTPQHAPFSPYSGQAWKVGASTTATVRIGGTTVRATSCHSPASACRSACCPTESARGTSNPRPMRAGPARSPPRRHPPDRPRHQDPIPGFRRPPTGPSRDQAGHLSGQKREPRRRRRPPRSQHPRRNRSDITSRRHPHSFSRPQTAALDTCAQRPARSAVGGLDSPIG